MVRHNSKNVLVALLITIISIFGIMSVYAVDNNIEPSEPNAVSFIQSSGNNYSMGTVFNDSRGYIHTYNINEKAPTLKWVAYVGNITGTFSLQDADGFAIYSWEITTTRGEIYATKEGPGTDNPANDDGNQGGIPEWENITCANLQNLTQEEKLFNHTITYGATADEDSYLHTFTQLTGGALRNPFWVGEQVYIDNDEIAGGCYGTHLNVNDTNQSFDWEQIVLTDQSAEVEGEAGVGTRDQMDIIYAALIENNTWSYRNGTTYDFQILLPQSGLEGAQEKVAFYFYIELI